MPYAAFPASSLFLAAELATSHHPNEHHRLQVGSVPRHRLANVRSRVGRAFPENRGPATKATPACSMPRHRLENVRSRVGRAFPENRGPTTGAAPADPKLHAMSS